MMNYIWAGMIFLSLVFSLFTGNTQEVSQSLISGAGEAVELLLSILGVLCFWSGIMEIAKRAKITDMLAKIFAPVLSPLFPCVDKSSEAMHCISLNISANLLGLGNAATPFGLQAMKELQKLNPIRDRASDSQVVFVVMNTASLQLLPTTLCAYRASFGSEKPFEVIPCVWLSSAVALLVGITVAKVLCTDERKKG
ncbi:MAG: spore maturation protein A [Ruminococcus sp.]|nr:spore maturation protein A [Ruminococcus sp.]